MIHNKVCNLVLFLAGIALLSTGLVLEFKLGHGRALSLFGYDRHAWGEVHFVLALSVVSLVVVHLALHWAWIKQFFACHTKLCVFAAAVAAALVLVPLCSPPVSGGEGLKHQRGYGHGR